MNKTPERQEGLERQIVLIGPNARAANIGRRLFLKALSLGALIALSPGRLWSFFLDKLEVRTVEKDDFRFDPHSGSVRWKDRRPAMPYVLRIEGLVQKPIAFTYREIMGFPSVTQVSDFHCVEGWSVKDIRWEGFRFEEIVKRARPTAEARYAVFHSLGRTATPAGRLDHYVESLPLAELLDPRKSCLLAFAMDGRPLTHDHGAPLRLVSPYDLGYKGAKYVTLIEFTSAPQPGWWTLANPIYPVDAPVPKDRLRNR